MFLALIFSGPVLSTENETRRDPPPNRGEKLLEDLKKNRVLPGQFRMRTLVWAIVGCSVLLALPRMLGWEYRWFFGFLWISAFGLAPLSALVAALFYPHWASWKRWLLAASCLTLAIAPFLIFLACLDAAEEIPETLLFTFLFFWLPQSLCIAGVWFFLFRRPRH